MRGKSKASKSWTHQVAIRVEGLKTDRLISKIMEDKISIRGLEYINDTEVRFCIASGDFKRVKALAGPLYRVTVMKEQGTMYYIKKFVKRPVLVAAAGLAFVLIITSSFFIKTVEIEGYKGIPETALRQCLAENNIETGSFIPNINWEKAEDSIYDTFPQVTWLRLVYDGRKVFLTISEGDEGDMEDADEKYYCNIIARHSGYIDNIQNYSGVSLVEEGDYVEEGQVLILGCVPINTTNKEEGSPTEYFVRAKGEIWGKIPYRLTFEQDMYDKNGRVKSEKEIIQKASQQLRLWAKEKLPENAEILNKDLNFCYKENIIEVSMTIEVRQQIGEEQEILIGQKNTDSSRN